MPLLTHTALGADEATQLVALLQDETPPLPKDNTALISADDQSIELRLAMLVDDYSADSEGLNDEAETRLFAANGDAVDFEADEEGNLKVENAKEGLHVLIAQTSDAIASVAFFVKQSEQAVLPEERTIDVPMIPNGGVAARGVGEIYLAKNDITPTGNLAGVQYESSERHGYRVRITGDGRVVGQVITVGEEDSLQLAANNNVFLLKNGVRQQNSLSDNTGSFEFKDVTPGVYGVVAAGPAGYTAFAFEAIDGQLVMQKMNKAGFVSKLAQDIVVANNDVLPVVLIPPQCINQTIDVLRVGNCIVRQPSNNFAGTPAGAGAGGAAPAVPSPGIPAPASVAASPVGGYAGAGGFPAAGGFGGGAGGGGLVGGGGAGGLASLAGVGGVIAAVATDDDAVSAPEPASPAVPVATEAN